MNKNKKSKPYTLYMIHVPILGLIAALALGGYVTYKTIDESSLGRAGVLSKSSNRGKGSSNSSAKNDNRGSSNKPNKLEKGNPNKVELPKPGDKKAPKGFNAPVYKQNMKKVVSELEGVAVVEDELGNEEVSTEIGDVAEEENEETEEVADAIDEIEGRGKFQTILFGSDYKNLGQLRSQLVRNRNNIRKLTKNMNGTTAQGSTEALQEQLLTMVDERERIKAIIEENETEFSILGWVTRFLTGYQYESVSDAEEVELLNEVQEATSSVPVL